MKIAETVTFGSSGLDRAAHLRGDVAALMANPDAGFMVIWRGKVLLDAQNQIVIYPSDHPLIAQTAQDVVFLGLSDAAAPVFAAQLCDWEPAQDDTQAGAFIDHSRQAHPDAPAAGFVELRAVLTLLSRRDAELAATARAVFEWHHSHLFCARCGQQSTMAMAGWQRDCSACGGHHFPRTDPVVIMLVTHGNSVLMGRSPGWPEGMYSLLAGFVEPGETIEAAVRREVFEEAGVRVGAVQYLASQPWPFPASLMFGCAGQATSTKITIDPNEIEDALWVTKEEMVDVFAGQHPTINPARKGAIAHFLLENWLSDRLDET